MIRIVIIVQLLFICSFTQANEAIEKAPYVLILGEAQDAGYPQAGCYKPHCMRAWNNPELRRSAVSFALIDTENKKDYLFEATPDVKQQLFQLHQETSSNEHKLNGIFLTHAHIGHYAGLVHFGFEVMGTKNINVYTLPRFADYLAKNGPWSQMVDYKNILLKPMQENQPVSLSNKLKVSAVTVPHRDEYSETAGFTIYGPNKNLLFIPDIDRWEKWSYSLIDAIKNVDYALLDGSFFTDGELPGRDMSKIPHPMVTSTMELLDNLSDAEKKKVYFIHFNHTNPLLNANSDAVKVVESKGFKIAREGMRLPL